MGLGFVFEESRSGRDNKVGRERHRPRSEMLEHYVASQRQEQKPGHQELKGDPSLGVGRPCEGREAE